MEESNEKDRIRQRYTQMMVAAMAATGMVAVMMVSFSTMQQTKKIEESVDKRIESSLSRDLDDRIETIVRDELKRVSVPQNEALDRIRKLEDRVVVLESKLEDISKKYDAVLRELGKPEE